MLLYAASQSRRRFSKSRGREPAQGRMGPDGVVKRLDVGEKVGLGSPAGIETAQVNQLAFQAAEKVFPPQRCRRGRPCGTCSAGCPGKPDAHGRPRRRTGRPRSLWKSQSRGRALPADGHVQGIQGELGVDALGKGITHDFSGAQVFDNGEIQPAFPGGDVGDVAHPGLVGGG